MIESYLTTGVMVGFFLHICFNGKSWSFFNPFVFVENVAVSSIFWPLIIYGMVE